MRKDDFIKYFDNLKEVLEDVPPTNILNYDETNLSDDPGNEKLIFKRGVKYPERIQNYTKGSTSVMFCGTATGDPLEPYVVYKATNMWNSWTTGGPPRARYNRSKSGWFDNVCFNDWFTTKRMENEELKFDYPSKGVISKSSEGTDVFLEFRKFEVWIQSLWDISYGSK